jgi:hypothetical protein
MSFLLLYLVQLLLLDCWDDGLRELCPRLVLPLVKSGVVLVNEIFASDKSARIERRALNHRENDERATIDYSVIPIPDKD